MLEVYFLFCCCCFFFVFFFLFFFFFFFFVFCCFFYMGRFMELVKDYGAKVKKYNKINKLINIFCSSG